MMVIFLTGLVAMILMRTLHKDIARYTKDDEDLEVKFLKRKNFENNHIFFFQLFLKKGKRCWR